MPTSFANKFGTAFDLPMERTRPSGRSYMDPARVQERWNRWQDRSIRQGMAPSYGGGGGGGGGGRGMGGGGAPGMTGMPQMPAQRRPMLPNMPMQFPASQIMPQDFWSNWLGDAGLMAFGNAPSMGMDYANAQARLSNGMGGLGDYGIVQQRSNPSLSPSFNQANARERFRRQMMMGQGGLVGAAQGALYG